MRAGVLSAVPPQPSVVRQDGTGTPVFVWVFRLALLGALGSVFVLGSDYAKAIAVAAFVFALWGDWDGGVRHLLRLIGFGAALAAAPFGAMALAPSIAANCGWSPMAATVSGGVLTICGVLLVMWVVSLGIHAAIKRSPGVRGLNHIFGAFFGAFEGALLVALFGWFFTTFEGPLVRMRDRAEQIKAPGAEWIVPKFDSLRTLLHEDATMRRLAPLNPLTQIPMMGAATDVAQCLTNPQATQAVLDDPRVRQFMELPEIQRHMNALQQDPDLRAALKHHDMSKIMSSSVFMAMLHDTDLHRVIFQNWDMLRGVIDRAAELQVNLGSGADLQSRTEAARQEVDSSSVGQ